MFPQLFLFNSGLRICSFDQSVFLCIQDNFLCLEGEIQLSNSLGCSVYEAISSKAGHGVLGVNSRAC